MFLRFLRVSSRELFRNLAIILVALIKQLHEVAILGVGEELSSLPNPRSDDAAQFADFDQLERPAPRGFFLDRSFAAQPHELLGREPRFHPRNVLRDARPQAALCSLRAYFPPEVWFGARFR